jgi:hypothetical protein
MVDEHLVSSGQVAHYLGAERRNIRIVSPIATFYLCGKTAMSSSDWISLAFFALIASVALVAIVGKKRKPRH